MTTTWTEIETVNGGKPIRAIYFNEIRTAAQVELATRGITVSLPNVSSPIRFSHLSDVIDALNNIGGIDWPTGLSPVTNPIKESQILNLRTIINDLEADIEISNVSADVYHDTIRINYELNKNANVEIWWSVGSLSYDNYTNIGNKSAGSHSHGYFLVPNDTNIYYIIRATIPGKATYTEVNSSVYVAAPSVWHEQTYNTVGTHELTLPSRPTTVFYTLSGAGGGGGGGGGGGNWFLNYNGTSGGGGGGGGAAVAITGDFTTSEARITIIIGAGGAGGTGGGNYTDGQPGTNGESSQIVIYDTGASNIEAPGANGGSGGGGGETELEGAGAGGAGGNGTDTGSTTDDGNPGTDGSHAVDPVPGSGGPPGTASPGANGGWGNYGAYPLETGQNGENAQPGIAIIGWHDY